MADLKKCPFCGGEADFIKDTRTIKCKCCGGAFICTNPLISTLEVAEAWNTRKPMERIIEQIEEELRESIELYKAEEVIYRKGIRFVRRLLNKADI